NVANIERLSGVTNVFAHGAAGGKRIGIALPFKDEGTELIYEITPELFAEILARQGVRRIPGDARFVICGIGRNGGLGEDLARLLMREGFMQRGARALASEGKIFAPLSSEFAPLGSRALITGFWRDMLPRASRRLSAVDQAAIGYGAGRPGVVILVED
ncbi:MAG: hypothetical protein L0322_18325, partial [Chloroflexi bacterium]|nr:hypothetical protein [Chloroflexota bacterium]